MNNGKIIVLEGSCDGIGKSTQFELLQKKLEGNNCKVINHHFPTYDESQGSLVVNYLSGSYGKVSDLSPYLINSFYATDMGITWNIKLKPEYEKGSIILLDRYITSSFIYQASTYNSNEEKIEFIKYASNHAYNKFLIKEPDITIFLDAPYDVIKESRNKRNETMKKDIHEKDEDYLKKVYETSHLVADYLKWTTIQCSKNGRMRTIEDIHEDILKIVNK